MKKGLARVRLGRYPQTVQLDLACESLREIVWRGIQAAGVPEAFRIESWITCSANADASFGQLPPGRLRRRGRQDQIGEELKMLTGHPGNPPMRAGCRVPHKPRGLDPGCDSERRYP